MELVQKLSWNKRNTEVETKEILVLNPKKCWACNPKLISREMHLLFRKVPTLQKVIATGNQIFQYWDNADDWLKYVYDYYKMIRVQNKESKINIQFYQFEYEKGKGTQIGLVRET